MSAAGFAEGALSTASPARLPRLVVGICALSGSHWWKVGLGGQRQRRTRDGRHAGDGVLRHDRAAGHPPFVRPHLFRSRAFAVANLAMLTYGVGFSAMFLGFVFFLAEAWHDSVLEAGLAISPGPITVVPVAILAARLGQRVGQRPLAVLGGLLTAAGAAALSAEAEAEPSFLLRWLPAALLSGIDVGLVMPTLNGAAVSTLPSERFAVGSAIHQAVRQLGGVLGVALAILRSTLDTPFPLLFGAVAITGVATSIISLGLPR